MTDSGLTVGWCLGMVAVACGALALNDALRKPRMPEPEKGDGAAKIPLEGIGDLEEVGEIQPWEVVGWVKIGEGGKMKAYWCCDHAWGKGQRKGMRKVRFAQARSLKGWGCAEQGCGVEW